VAPARGEGRKLSHLGYEPPGRSERELTYGEPRVQVDRGSLICRQYEPICAELNRERALAKADCRAGHPDGARFGRSIIQPLPRSSRPRRALLHNGTQFQL
jgi:hypothetical protein